LDPTSPALIWVKLSTACHGARHSAGKITVSSSTLQIGSSRFRVPVFVGASLKGGRGVAVIAEEQEGQDSAGAEAMGRIGEEVFNQGEAVFAEVNGVYADYM